MKIKILMKVDTTWPKIICKYQDNSYQDIDKNNYKYRYEH